MGHSSSKESYTHTYWGGRITHTVEVHDPPLDVPRRKVTGRDAIAAHAGTLQDCTMLCGPPRRVESTQASTDATRHRRHKAPTSQGTDATRGRMPAAGPKA